MLANDADPDGDPLSVVLVTPPAHGVVTLRADGSLEYTPDRGWYGRDAFSYLVSDGQAAGEITPVSLTVRQAWPTGVADPVAPAQDAPVVLTPAGGTGGGRPTPVGQDRPGPVTTGGGSPSGGSVLRRDGELTGAARPRPTGNTGGVVKKGASEAGPYVGADGWDGEWSDDGPAASGAARLAGTIIATPRLVPPRPGRDATGAGRVDAPAVIDREEPEAPATAASPALLGALDRLGEEIAAGVEVRTVSVALATGTVVSVGYVVWTLRTSYLLFGLAAWAPFWRELDPFEILRERGGRARRRRFLLPGDDDEPDGTAILDGPAAAAAPGPKGVPGRPGFARRRPAGRRVVS